VPIGRLFIAAQPQIVIHGQQQYLQGALLAFSGDTPAACKVGGFKEGVGFAERKCCHCMATAEDISEKVCNFQSGVTMGIY